MYEKKIPKIFDCGLSVLMEVIGGKWKGYLLHLISHGMRRPNELQKEIKIANRRALDLQLRELEFHGLIHRVIHNELPPRVEYFLTDCGKSLLPVLEVMTQWGDDYLDHYEELFLKKDSISSVIPAC
ncbi:MAG: helix-turn-helix domain-containing protein [Chryseolinea sp.]